MSGAVEHYYSDGEEIESRIAHAIDSASDVSMFSDDLRGYRTDWPSHYHLSPSRANLLRPLDRCLTGSILEVGAGCGAITRYLGELGEPVIALEGSPRRSRIAAQRCRDLTNVRIVQEVFDRFETDSTFEAVVLVGVLEYCRIYGTGIDPAVAWLTKARKLLSNSGCLILAIENQLGLKYFAGVAEDHLGTAMSGIGDVYGTHSPVTFGRVELERMLRKAGFTSIEFAIPVPDYKLPSSVIVPPALAVDNNGFDAVALVRQAAKNDRQLRHAPLFALGQAWGVVGRNDLLLDLANSFLVVAKSEAEQNASNVFDPTVLAYHFASERFPHFCTQTVFRKHAGGIKVERKSLCPQKPACSKDLKLRSGTEEYSGGKIWGDELESVISHRGWTIGDVGKWLYCWIDALTHRLGEQSDSVDLGAHTTLPGNLFDALPRNLAVSNDRPAEFFDLEWESQTSIDYGFLLYRAITVSFGALPAIASPADSSHCNLSELTTAVMRHVGVSVTKADLKGYVELDAALRSQVFGDTDSMSTDAFFEINLPLLPDVTELVTSSNRTARALANAQHLAVSRYEEIERLNAVLAEAQHLATSRYEEIERLYAALAEAQRLATSRYEEIERLYPALAEAQRLATSRFEDISRLQGRIVDAENVTHSLSSRLMELEAELRQWQLKATELQERLDAVFNSKSWQWTRGFRSLALSARRLFSGQ